MQQSAVVFADETSWKFFDNNKAEKKSWQVWVLGCDDAVHYRIQDGSGEDQARELLGGYQGNVMYDAYNATLRSRRTAPISSSRIATW